MNLWPWVYPAIVIAPGLALTPSSTLGTDTCQGNAFGPAGHRMSRRTGSGKLRRHEQGRDLGGRFFLHGRDGVGVDVEGDADIGMP
jgi:hypothetical protein